MSLGIMRARAYFFIKKNQLLTEKRVERDLSLEEVKKTNVKPVPGIDYKIIYRVRTYLYTDGISIQKNTDTVQVLLNATPSCGCSDGPKPNLPKPLSWGTLNWR